MAGSARQRGPARQCGPAPPAGASCPARIAARGAGVSYPRSMTDSPVTVPSVRLSGGVEIPQVGFGTFQIPPADTQRAVEEALALGYRHIDTAEGYLNEAEVGAALRASGLPREQVFVTTKLRNADQGRETARTAFEASREALGVEAVDLFLIHWPVPARDLFAETWQTLVELLDEGAVRAIGVSNFLPEHLARIVEATGVAPAVNQIEVHPTFAQPAACAASASRGIAVEAYSPLGQGADLSDPAVAGIAERLGLTPGQVVLGWHLRAGRIVIPKSTHLERMRENLGAAAVADRLTAEDLTAVDALDRGPAGRIGGDPATFDAPQTPEDVAARFETGL